MPAAAGILSRALLPRQPPSRERECWRPISLSCRGARLRPRADRARAGARCADRPGRRAAPGRVRACSIRQRSPPPTPRSPTRLLSRVVSCLGGSRYPARTARLARLRAALTQEPRRARTLGGCRFVPWRGRVLVLRELARGRGSDRARTGRRSVLGPALRRLALVASNRRGHARLSRAICRRGAGRRFRANTAASGPFRAARVLGRRGRRGGAASRLCPARSAGSAGAFVSARQAADTAELYSCLGSGASYLLLARHLRHWRIGPGAEGVGKGL